LVHWHSPLTIQGAPDLDHREFRNAPHPFVADAEAPSQLTKRELPVRVESVLQGKNLEFTVIEIVQAGHDSPR
jgi:hypothetical protein